MAASPYDQRKKTRKAQLDQVRQTAQQRMQTVAKLERRGHNDTTNGPRPLGPARSQGQTGPATVINGDKLPSVAGPRRDAQIRKVWETALGVRYSPARQATRGELVLRGDKRFYRRRSDGKAIPIDSSGRVIRRRGVSP